MINRVLLIGNLGSDPEVRYTQNGTSVASFSLATTERRKGQDGQTQDFTEWHRCVAWNKLAEICEKYLHKGSKIYIEGRLQTRKWQDKSGADHYTTEIIIREMKMLDGGAGRQKDPNEWVNGGNGEYVPPSPGPVNGDDVPF